MRRDPDCVFCRIVAGSAPGIMLAEDVAALAFMDIHPANPGHCLVIPKAHWPTVFDIPPEEFASVARLAVRVAAAVDAVVRPAGLSLVQANGASAGQTVPHLHVHVLPRRQGDDLPLNWSRTTQVARSQIAELGERIRSRLAAAPVRQPNAS